MTALRIRSLRFSRSFAFGAASLILALGIIIGLINEASYGAQKLKELGVQASILAEGVTAPLMFSDPGAALDYASALVANPQVEQADIYDAEGHVLASFHRDRKAVPPPAPLLAPPHFSGQYAEVAAPVERDGKQYGIVFLRVQREPATSRLSRYSAIALLIVMAALVLLVAGAAQGELARANLELESRAAALAEMNKNLSQEIEHRKEVEEALLQSRKMEAIGQLTGGVAHDFNNLLMAISGGLRLLEKQDEARQNKIKEAMSQAVERGVGLTRQLLAFARRQSQDFKTIDVEQQIGGMRELLDRSLRADILLDISFPPNLAPIKVDPGEFELAILNLAVNARDAMPKGGLITLTARAANDPHGDRVEVILQDTGTGIPPEIRDRIFEPYFTTKQVGQGTGLGLSQVYGFIKQSGGEIRIESAVGLGTTMILSFPASKEKLTVSAPKARQRAASGKDERAVLMVEDDDAVAETVCAMLIDLGHDVTRARSVDEALDVLERGKPFDIVFSDVIMPGGKSGIDLVRILKETKPGLPVLLTSGYSGSDARDAGCPLLRKPYQIDDLREAISSVT
ncbi:MAG TPA: ATP-binding protein [Caulobacterales bacterium]|nr:ATP-binding protein [Caulobacterales bacterium]